MSGRDSKRDWLEQRLSELREHLIVLFVLLALCAGLAAFLLAPTVDTRPHVSRDGTLFEVAFYWLIAILGIYAAFAIAGKRQTSEFYNRPAVALAILGLVAAILGRLTIPLGLYQFMFAFAAVGVTHGTVTVGLVLME
jgi:hypothetical protein